MHYNNSTLYAYSKSREARECPVFESVQTFNLVKRDQTMSKVMSDTIKKSESGAALHISFEWKACCQDTVHAGVVAAI